MPKKKNWITGALKHPGSFDAYCKRQGMNGATASCIAKGVHSPNATTRHRANLARTLEKLQKPHHKKIKR